MDNFKETKQKEALLQKIKHEEEIRKVIEESGQRQKEPNLLKISNCLDEYYFFMKMEVYCTYLYYKEITNPELIPYKEEDLKLVPEIVTTLSLSLKDRPPLTVIYFKLAQLLRESSKTKNTSNISILSEIDSFILKEYNNINHKDLLGVFTVLLNFCARNLNLGEKEYFVKYLKYGNEVINIEFGTCMDKESYLAAALFQNMIKIMLRYANHDLLSNIHTINIAPEDETVGFKTPQEWCHKFIKYYYNKIPETQNRDLYHNYCHVLVLFSEKDYFAAYNSIRFSIAHYKGLFFSLEFRLLYLQVIYEIYRTDSTFIRNHKIDVESEIENYRGKLRYSMKSKEEKLGYHATYFKEFIPIIKRLFQLYVKRNFLTPKNKDKNIEKIKALLENKNYYYILWVQEKLNEI